MGMEKLARTEDTMKNKINFYGMDLSVETLRPKVQINFCTTNLIHTTKRGVYLRPTYLAYSFNLKVFIVDDLKPALK
jgi:hypothetical protein